MQLHLATDLLITLKTLTAWRKNKLNSFKNNHINLAQKVSEFCGCNKQFLTAYEVPDV
jgi:hypothetical protein